MPLDALCLYASAEELRNAVVGARIDKIHQPGREEVVLALRRNAENCNLLLSGGGSQPRAQLTALRRENPAQPPMFCMLLRRHLAGGRILSVTQPPMERVLRFVIEATDELGDRVEKTLMLEALGKQGNLILCDADGRIIDCVRRLEGDLQTGRRALMPGMFYRLPPAPKQGDAKQGDGSPLRRSEAGNRPLASASLDVKENPLTVTREAFSRLIAAAPGEQTAEAWLMQTFGGISPLIARELAHRATGETDGRMAGHEARLTEAFFTMIEAVKENRFTSTILLRDGEPVDYSFTDITQYGGAAECKPMESFAALFDVFFETRERANRTRQRGADLLRALNTARERTARKVENQTRELADAAHRERLREFGDLLTSNLHLLTRGQSHARVPDYYDPSGGEVSIPIDPLRTPQQNAAQYYKRYQKAKTAARVLVEQIERGRADLAYLASVSEALDRADGESDLLEIRQELEGSGYLKPPKGGNKKRPKLRNGPIELRTTAGLVVHVGRNNLQNDQLTKTAAKYDLWLHVQGLHGAHVILRTEGRKPDADSITEAARFAAQYSQAKPGVKVSVDYTPVKFIKKPAGARPGFVTYKEYETAVVTAD